MLTINADNDPVFRRFHKPEDEKRSVVILPDDAWGDWLRCKSEDAARAMLEGRPRRWSRRPILGDAMRLARDSRSRQFYPLNYGWIDLPDGVFVSSNLTNQIDPGRLCRCRYIHGIIFAYRQRGEAMAKKEPSDQDLLKIHADRIVKRQIDELVGWPKGRCLTA